MHGAGSCTTEVSAKGPGVSTSDLAGQVKGYSEAIRLGHAGSRLRELQPQLSDLLASLERLDRVDLDGVEMALEYPRPARGQEPGSAESGSPVASGLWTAGHCARCH
jgi:hypothetical protein